jgi:formiminotetrahydrofolate cyclodeaminase
LELRLRRDGVSRFGGVVVSDLDCTLRAYLDAVAAKTPTPGGGSVSALAGAFGAAIGAMAAAFTASDAGAAAAAGLRAARDGLAPLADADAAAYRKVHDAMALPKRTPAEKRARTAALQQALRGAAEVPLDGMRRCVAALERAAAFAPDCNPNLASDLAVAALLLEAACRGCGLNVDANLKWITDPAFQEPRAAERAALETKAGDLRERVVNPCGR